ncbi:MAG: type I-U CRISPR-associated helicase/endonuclease Cas3 [Chromatiaceae bacterium]|nr:type I-U CRISPR-associated helicase/endonuclease Cas3 [Chromatiaceae bacterium]MBP6733594.1 type I-U CRISPR-associated helicase/endonuclease Cas3 [Chromatiaceae bacterium]MBP6806919.1 type I-U CRISPR-associated helicase/endonuclease Cas3 [Chromatiaceae bacterium]MBP8282469.1 type I-U CRISPR-associated helicase/endonuclease Cas3 [Chromatiaceae bacterium]MBP8288383.1 type I-U CRISPR-associated helicase/endonuclease Cas3 [Chromatiaceae bacterium]
MDFAHWYQERHGYPPFPWQEALAHRFAQGDWPDALTPPTGAGKTAVIDVWLWARLAEHPVPRRLSYIIDRRLVVDGFQDYAQSLADSLPASDRPVIVHMRGGITIDNDWVREPERPTLIISTLDQAGSRLLFSGYGVSPTAAPIHAALLGTDTLWVLDEVHLAQPLLQTLGAVQALGASLRVMPMSATWDSPNTLGLTAADLANPVLAKRFGSPKPASLVKVAPIDDLTDELAKQARALRQAGSEVVAVVCNRVATARAVFEELRHEGEAVLLTGRIRPADKAALLEAYLPRLAVGSRGKRKSLYLVATQTIEVGADLDFDAMVTECAPISALRQRAGRLNRLGELATAALVIVYQPLKDDKVYGKAVAEAWFWLTKVARAPVRGQPKIVDFGVSVLGALLAAKPPPQEEIPQAPLLLRTHIDLLASNTPHGLEIAPWLHGWQRNAADVYLCWRADWGPESLAAAPPRQQELLAVPLWAAQRWSADIADVEGAQASEAGDRTRRCLRWDGETAEMIRLGEARIGDTLVLPCTLGGCDAYGWAPALTVPVKDVGDDQRRMRLHPEVHPEFAAEIAALLADEDTRAADWRRLAIRAGMSTPGRVKAIPRGCVVTERGHWDSATARVPVSLSDHSKAVGAEIWRLAEALGITEPGLLEAVTEAGRKHDIGKADPRWQAMVGWTPGQAPLAKGPGGARHPWLILPRGWRHEMASVARLKQTAPLARYLVGTHHGHGRPHFSAAPEVELWQALGDWAGLRTQLVKDHGYWGLALLEALVRLADWRVSGVEQAGGQ